MERKMIITDFSTHRKQVEGSLRQLFEELETVELEILECIDKLELVDFEVKRVTRRRNRRTDFVKSIEKRMDEVDREIVGIHESYTKFGEVVYSDDENEELERLMMERRCLEKFYNELKVIADAYDEKLSGITEKTTFHKKKKMSDACQKLKELSETDYVPCEIADGIDDLVHKLHY